MNQKKTVFVLVVLFLVSVSLLFYGYQRLRNQVTDLETTISGLAIEDPMIGVIEKIWTGYSLVESDARSYILSRDHHFLEKFYQKKDSLSLVFDSIKNVLPDTSLILVQLDTLNLLFDQKAVVYDSILELEYFSEVSKSLKDLSEKNIHIEDVPIQDKQGNVLQRLFDSRFSRKNLQQRTDSILEQRNRELQIYNRSQKAIREQEEAELQHLADIEFRLLQEDGRLDDSIEDLISRMKLFRTQQFLDDKNSMINAGIDDVAFFRKVVLFGVISLLVLLIIILYQVNQTFKYSSRLSSQKVSAENLAQAREEFLSSMSHEIRTPLSSLIGNINRLESDVEDKEFVKLKKRLVNSSSHLLNVVNDILDNARIERGELIFKQESFEPFVVLSETTDQFTLQCEQKSIKLEIDFKDIKGVVLSGDPMRLRQVIYNLLGNAVKFTNSGTISVRCSYKTEGNKGILKCLVSDTGIGIPEGKLNSIFNPYSDISTESSGKITGTGLGLSITKKIIDQQGGELSVKSNIEKGTEFQFTIPYVQILEQVTEKKVQTETKSLRGIKVVLIEDDPVIAELMMHDLGSLQAVASHFYDIDSLNDNIVKLDPDILLMDLQIGDQDGLGLLSSLRNSQIGKLGSVPAIAVTANKFLEEKAITGGFIQVLIKPVNREVLADTIRKCLNATVNKTSDVETIKYDLSELESASNGDQKFIVKMINIFLSNSFAGMNNMRSYLKRKDWTKIGGLAHKLAPSFEQMGIAKEASILRKIEELSSQSDRTEIEINSLCHELFATTESIFDQLKDEIKKRSI